MESLQRDISDERDARRPDGRDELDKSNARPPALSEIDAISATTASICSTALAGQDSAVRHSPGAEQHPPAVAELGGCLIAGQFVSSFSLAGIGGVNPVTAMFVNLFVGLSIGANVVVAMHVGAGESTAQEERPHGLRSHSSPGWSWAGRGSPWPPGC